MQRHEAVELQAIEQFLERTADARESESLITPQRRLVQRNQPQHRADNRDHKKQEKGIADCEFRIAN